MVNGAKRWCFTINFKGDGNDPQGDIPEQFRFVQNIFGTAADGPQSNVVKFIDYIICQREKGEEGGNVHFQGFVIFKKRVTLKWITENFWKAGHYEVAKGTIKQCIEYCSKTKTFFPFKDRLQDALDSDGHWQRGTLPTRGEAPKRGEMLMDAAEELDILKEGYKRPREISTLSLLQPGFYAAYKMLTDDILGPYRPDLKIITMIGRPGTGKSYAIHKIFEDQVGRALYCNNGTWFQNPTAEVMVFEEFCGQIQLQRMLQYLDPYPLSLEVKGKMAPAMYKIVIITSNSRPDAWYKGDEAGQPGKRTDALLALWDRIGFTSGAYVPVRTCGHYLEEPAGLSIDDARRWFLQQVARIVNWVETIDDDDEQPEHESLSSQDTPCDSDSA